MISAAVSAFSDAGSLDLRPREKGFAPSSQFCDLPSVSISPTVVQQLGRVASTRHSALADGSVSIEANSLRSDGANNWFMEGHVHVRNGQQGVFADRADFNEITRIARFYGNVYLYSKAGHSLSGEDLQLDIDMFNGTMTDNASIYFIERVSPIKQEHDDASGMHVSSVLSNDNSRLFEDSVAASGSNYRFSAKATAQVIDINGEHYHVIHDASLTSCPGENPDVVFTASEVELDHEQQQGRAENLVVRFKNVPVFYFPKVFFPLGGERMSGFLFPRIGYQKRSGLILSLPYYLNLHPQYDATIMPSIISKRGLQIHGETRYMTENSKGIFIGEVLPDDDVYNDDRYAFSYRHKQSFFRNAQFEVDMEKMSDPHYRSDFADNIDSRASAFSRQKVSFSFRNKYMRLHTRAISHEVANGQFMEREQPYDLLPEFRLQLKDQKFSIFAVGARAELTRYRHDTDKIAGTRLRFIPHLSIPVRKVYGYMHPKVAVHSIRYDLRNRQAGERRLSESIPVWSIDSGLYFERTVNYGGQGHLQTLEPRLFYLDVPQKYDQNDFPNFDTSIGNLNSMSHYFRENRFFGGDRVGDTRQVTAGLTSRLINQESGREKIKISLGKVFYFKDRKIGEDADSPAETANSSNLLFEFESALNRRWTFSGFASWSEEFDEFSYLSLLSRYETGKGTSNEAGYIQDQDQREYVKLDHSSQYAKNWLYRIRTHYSILDDQFQFAEISSSYLNCCWSFGIKLQRYQNNGNRDNRVMISFSLKGLGGH